MIGKISLFLASLFIFDNSPASSTIQQLDFSGLGGKVQFKTYDPAGSIAAGGTAFDSVIVAEGEVYVKGQISQIGYYPEAGEVGGSRTKVNLMTGHGQIEVFAKKDNRLFASFKVSRCYWTRYELRSVAQYISCNYATLYHGPEDVTFDLSPVNEDFSINTFIKIYLNEQMKPLFVERISWKGHAAVNFKNGASANVDVLFTH